jgi:signal peptidase I
MKINIPFFKKKEDKKKLPKSKTREWVDAIVFAVIAATLIRWATLEAFTIPTPSMESSLLVGDFLFVSKLHYGPRTPKTPLQIPLTHRRIWGTNIPSYLDWIQLPQYRFPSFTSVKNNDVVVFNYPKELDFPLDLRENYIKRCIAIGGDTIQIKNAVVYVNGKLVEDPKDTQYSYFVKSKEHIRDRVFDELGIWEVSKLADRGYYINATPAQAKQLAKLNFIEEVIPSPNLQRSLRSINEDDAEYDIFPYGAGTGWNKNFYGPLWIPKKGATISLTEENVKYYAYTIEHYEGLKNVEIINNQLFVNGTLLERYTFKQDYYFMMGDNRHNSLDSRYWGFVPEDHVVGKALFIWMSIDPNKSLLNGKIRFNRLFSGIH